MTDIPKPPEKPTVKMETVPEWATALTLKVQEGFRQTNANIEVVSSALDVVKERVHVIESWKVDQDARLQNNSMRAKQASVVDLAHEAQLAQERTAREALALKVQQLDGKQDVQLALLQQLVKLGEKPVVKLLFTAVGTAILTWLSAKGLR